MSDSFVTLWIVARQAPLSLPFPRQEYWSRLPFPPPGDLPDSGIEPVSLLSPALAARLFITKPPWKSWFIVNLYFLPSFLLPSPPSLLFGSSYLILQKPGITVSWHPSMTHPVDYGKFTTVLGILEIRVWVLILGLSAALNSWSWVTGFLVLTPSLLTILPSVVPLTHGSASSLVTSTTLIDLKILLQSQR